MAQDAGVDFGAVTEAAGHEVTYDLRRESGSQQGADLSDCGGSAGRVVTVAATPCTKSGVPRKTSIMTIRDLPEMPWIGEDPVLDLANTVVGAGPGRGDVDFLADRELTRRWRARAADRGLAALSLEELERLRELVRDALDATAGQRPLTDGLRSRLNELASSAPVVFWMTGDGLLARTAGTGRRRRGRSRPREARPGRGSGPSAGAALPRPQSRHVLPGQAP